MNTNRSSGVILPIFSLPGPFGSGDLGPSAYRFADLLHACGFKYWQVLPLNPIAKSSGYSPYSSNSAFAGNTLFISPELLVKDGYLLPDEIINAPDFSQNKVEYAQAIRWKENLLQKAFNRFLLLPAGRKKNFEKFRKAQQNWLQDFALFSVLQNKFGALSWLHWPKPLRDREPEALASFSEENATAILYVAFCQFLFFQQWRLLRQYANQRGLFFFGDLPFYVSFESAEVWAKPAYFKLNAKKQAIAVSGVPPDYFSETGQRWGTPVYHWKNLKTNQYDWWIERLALNLKLFDVVRLDHFRAFYNYWEIPAAEKTAVNGRWKPGPAADFFRNLKQTFPNLPFIAEDLGDIHPGVYALRDQFKLPGMLVLQYGFGADIGSSVFALHNHHPNMIVYTGTHDNNTTRGWWRQEMNPEDRKRSQIYLNQQLSEENVSLALIKTALMSVADLAIFPLQDLLNLDESAIMNRPSTVENNWEWRVTEEQIKGVEPEKWRALLNLYGRLAKQ